MGMDHNREVWQKGRRVRVRGRCGKAIEWGSGKL